MKRSSTARPDQTDRDATHPRRSPTLRMLCRQRSSSRSASFLAIVPPIAQVEVIQSVQRKCGIETDVSPHITVKAQPGLQRPDSWRKALRLALLAVRPFQLALGPVGWFGSEILYLSVAGEAVVDLHRRILDCLEQAGVNERFEYDGEEFVPHLTVGAPWVTAHDRGLDELEAAIKLRELPLTGPGLSVGSADGAVEP
jgi:2'-5' RNA ligase